jgi:hypothetical protein
LAVATCSVGPRVYVGPVFAYHELRKEGLDRMTDSEWAAELENGRAPDDVPVTRGSASLPTLIVWALAPREGQGLLENLLPTMLFLFGALGVAAILRLRTWGLLALGAAVGLALAVTLLTPSMAVFASASGSGSDLPLTSLWQTLANPLLAVGWGALAILPFALPIARFLRR